jgi:outer membrane lipoprotein-sorting protein
MTVRMIILVAIAMLMAGEAAAQDAREIIRRMEDRMRGESSQVEMTMTIERPRFTREVSMKAWALGERYSLILITAPARDQGTVFLKRRNEIWNFVPSIDRTIKMPPSMMAQSWMGSDFSNDDLVRESSTIDDFTHRVLRTETYQGREAHVIELIPKPEAAVVWGKVLVWVSTGDYIQLRVENYDQGGKLANTLTFDQIRQMGGRTVPTRMTMVPADRPNQRTILTYQSMQFNVALNESFFTQQNMRRVR